MCHILIFNIILKHIYGISCKQFLCILNCDTPDFLKIYLNSSIIFTKFPSVAILLPYLSVCKTFKYEMIKHFVIWLDSIWQVRTWA